MKSSPKNAAEGPVIEGLLHRLAECPPEFYQLPPRQCVPRQEPGNECNPATEGLDAATVQVKAIVGDQLRSLQPDFPCEDFLKNRFDAQTINHASLLAILGWTLHDEWFVSRPEMLKPMQNCFCSLRLVRLAELVKAEHCVQDPDRREELVRIALAEMGLLPAGESVSQAKDRLTILDSVERQRVLKATLAAEKRAREVREAMQKAKALEASSRYGE